MEIHSIMQRKKQWKGYMLHVKSLPKDYQVVYKQIQKYIFKVGHVDSEQSEELLFGIIDFFEESAARGNPVLEVIGNDVAAFCDNLIKGSETYTDICQKSIDENLNKSVDEYIKKKLE